MFEIEKDVAVPTGANTGKYAETFTAMTAGDSFLIPTDKIAGARAGVLRHARVNNLSIKTAKVEGGLRVWLVA